jgi:hypothetical protein
MKAASTAYRKAAHLERWSSAGRDLARLVAPHPWPIATAKQRLEPPNRLAGIRTSPSLHAQSTIPTVPAAAKSP